MSSGFGKDTSILLMNGYVKISQDIRCGDILLGDDGTERIVNQIYTGEDELYEIKQRNGLSYTVNSKHILVLMTKDEESQTELEIQMSVEQYIHISDPLKDLLLGYKINPRSEIITTHFTATRLGKGTYYGWSIDNSNNGRFLANDFTVLKDSTK